MKKLTYLTEVNRKKLTGELQAAGIAVTSVETILDEDFDFVATQVYVADETDEQAVEAIVNAHNPVAEIDILKNDSRQWLIDNTPVANLVKASPAQIKNAVDAMTTAQLKEALTFLLILAKILIKREL